MEKPVLVELKGQDQIDRVLSSLQEIVESGTSVFFSFSTSGRATVLLASPPSRAEVTDLCRHIDRSIYQKPIGPGSEEGEIGSEAEKQTAHNSVTAK
jgi:hypothetical protein